MLQTYFPSLLMVLLPLNRQEGCACTRLSGCPNVKVVDIYLWTSFLFVFLPVIEYAAVNYCSMLEEMRRLNRGKLPTSYNASQAMAFDGCFHGNDIERTLFPHLPNSLNSNPHGTPPHNPEDPPNRGDTSPPTTAGAAERGPAT
uniref:Uncharacterized protein n=1 Tax=Hucho hucho TaxID=62062 RepID=A0A4W5MWN1_9TELE